MHTHLRFAKEENKSPKSKIKYEYDNAKLQTLGQKKKKKYDNANKKSNILPHSILLIFTIIKKNYTNSSHTNMCSYQNDLLTPLLTSTLNNFFFFV